MALFVGHSRSCLIPTQFDSFMMTRPLCFEGLERIFPWLAAPLRRKDASRTPDGIKCQRIVVPCHVAESRFVE